MVQRVAVIGAAGRLGSVIASGVAACDDLELVAAVSRSQAGRRLGEVVRSLPAGHPAAELVVAADLDGLVGAGVDVAVEVTGPASVGPHLVRLLELGIHAVVGATGIPEADLATARRLAASGPARALVAPNFALGAVLLERLAAEVARHLPDVEIVELHHDAKLDAPSGTAIATARAIAEARAGRAGPTAVSAAHPVEHDVDRSRGSLQHGVPVHAVRLPGLVAHEEVIFGALGQTLTLRHDAYDRTAFVPGALLACRRVSGLDGLVVGLGALL
jgi:4-hydroxy-tetrahydrodipicolinate reductase